MQKIFLNALLALNYFAICNATEPTKEHIKAAYRWAKIEDAGLRLVSFLSSCSLLAYLLKRELSVDPVDTKGFMLLMGAAIPPLSYVPLLDGYYVAKYGVSWKVADAARFTGHPLSLNYVKQMFLDAERRDTKALKESLARVLKEEIGANWRESLLAHMPVRIGRLLCAIDNLHSGRFYTGQNGNANYVLVSMYTS